MTAMPGNNILQADIFCITRQFKIHRHIFTGKYIGVSLTNIINGIHQRLYMTFGQRITTYLTLFYLNVQTDNIAFGRPRINKNTYIGFLFQCRIKIGNILFPNYILCPFRNINRLALSSYFILFFAIKAYSKRSHKAHQF